MTLLTQQENKDCGTQLFDEKKNIYQKSNAKLSQKYLNTQNGAVKHLIVIKVGWHKQAVNTWSINYG
ncbi:hypothetical protein BSPWISOXPB_3281 [uncultured Gammaproteobacteria bacterium]|nr:hypothetical protein BSPWISOXPB_3281 [uncultured Gammaproteobacteria bacterium]